MYHPPPALRSLYSVLFTFSHWTNLHWMSHKWEVLSFLYRGKCCLFSSVGAARCWPGVSLLILPSISNITCLQHGSESDWFSSLFAADTWPFDLAHWKVIVPYAASVRSLQQWQSSCCSARPNSFFQDRCGGSWGRECDVGRALAELTPGLLTLQNNHAGSHVWRSGVVGSPRYLVLFWEISSLPGRQQAPLWLGRLQQP